MAKRPHKKELWYLRGRAAEQRASTIFGIIMALGINAGMIGAINFSGFNYIYPPPAEESILLDYTADEDFVPKQRKSTRQAVSENPDRTKPVELVKESKSTVTGTKPSPAKESTVGDKGDVEVPEPPREKPIDNRALFSNPDNKTEKDTLAQHTSRDITEALEAGHPQGNVTKGPENGTPNANVEGRTVVNGLPRPAYNSNSDGTVVVDIEVDRAGKVIKAVAGGKGTNTSDQKLWNAAVEAAKQTKFNVKNDDPEKQPGKITYYFKFNQ